jgi:hypothetical protein
MSSVEMRKSALRRYIVFRIKAIEFLDINALRFSLKDSSIAESRIPLPSFPPFRRGTFVSDSLRTVVMSWLCLFIDKSRDGMDVIDLWSTVFPQHEDRVKVAWTKMEPAWGVLREFRDRAGFHADRPLKFFRARHRLQREWGKVEAAIKEFEELFKFFLKAEERELPEIENALDSLLDDIEKDHGGTTFRRPEFKAYVMITNTRQGT